MRKHITQKIRNNINQHNKYTISVNIPKIIHQIWIGDNPMPTLWINSVKDFASTYGYKYMLWNNSNIKLLDWKSFEGLTELYNKMTKTGKYEGSGDIIRLLALYKFGGIYIDADSVIVKPEKFNVFLNENKASVFFGWEKFSKDRRIEYNDQQFTVKKLIANGLIGSTVKNAFIQLLLTNLYESFKMNPKKKTLDCFWSILYILYIFNIQTYINRYNNKNIPYEIFLSNYMAWYKRSRNAQKNEIT